MPSSLLFMQSRCQWATESCMYVREYCFQVCCDSSHCVQGYVKGSPAMAESGCARGSHVWLEHHRCLQQHHVCLHCSADSRRQLCRQAQDAGFCRSVKCTCVPVCPGECATMEQSAALHVCFQVSSVSVLSNSIRSLSPCSKHPHIFLVAQGCSSGKSHLLLSFGYASPLQTSMHGLLHHSDR